ILLNRPATAMAHFDAPQNEVRIDTTRNRGVVERTGSSFRHSVYTGVISQSRRISFSGPPDGQIADARLRLQRRKAYSGRLQWQCDRSRLAFDARMKVILLFLASLRSCRSES